MVAEPLIRFGREVCGDLVAGLRREWLVTTGLGGFASGTLAGPATRRYHGLLVAALHPPVERTVMVGALDERATYRGAMYALSAHEFGDTLAPSGFVLLQSFALEGLVPCWTFALRDALLEKRVWMEAGTNTTYVSYRLARADSAAVLDVTPLTCARDSHSLQHGGDWAPEVRAVEDGLEVAFAGAPPLSLLCAGAEVRSERGWWWGFAYREEKARGLDDRGDLFAPGTLRILLEPGETKTLVLSVEPGAIAESGEAALGRERQRERALLTQAAAEDSPAFTRQLVLAADQFIVARKGGGKTVIAGYPWFSDWGRDTFIALPGLCLATGRAGDAADILESFASYLQDGLLPNNFADSAAGATGYNTADASLWWIQAARAYAEATGDAALIDRLLPAIVSIVEWRLRGTRYGIGVDPADGLLRAGEPGVQLTWMDAKVGDYVVTPRIGKPVEINALWYNALRTVAGFLGERGRARARYTALAEQCRASFVTRFVPVGGGSLADVVDGPDGDDWTIRPNQILAVSLPNPLIEGVAARAVVTAVGHSLLMSYGLRSRADDGPDYRGVYGGGVWERDTAYHQGTAWSWLMGPYVDAVLRTSGDRKAARALVEPFRDHLFDAGLGSISEIFDGAAPHAPRGCIAQAWAVGEVLRVLRKLEDAPADGLRVV